MSERPDDVRLRVGLLAPMTHELAPLVTMLGLEPRSDDPYALHDATVDGVVFIAAMTGIGMAAAADATHRILDDGPVDCVIVVGIAGGIEPGQEIGDVLVPEAVLHSATGATYAPAVLGDHTPRGKIRCGDDFLTDDGVLAALVDDGFVALDMETAAVAAVCEARGASWTAFRSISDRPSDGLVDTEVWEMTQIDGSADEDRLTRYLQENPEAAARLAQMAADMEIAVNAAAAAAIRACGVEPNIP
jgi:adenosylhomocysteine nucleosidase